MAGDLHLENFAADGHAGMLLATLFPAWETALLGYALVGAGCSNIVPVLYTAVGKQKVMPEHIAVPAITTLGYAGILAGPAMIGFIAHGSSLSIAFVLVAMLLAGVASEPPMIITRVAPSRRIMASPVKRPAVMVKAYAA